MALPPRPTDFNIPGLSQQPITSDGRGPSAIFVRFWQEVRVAIVAALNGIQGQVTVLADIVRRLDSQQAQILAQNATILLQQAAINQALGLSQIGITAANNAQTTADSAGGGTARSGFADNPALTLAGTAWVTGPIVNLTGVSAGDLTITGSGPQQDDDVDLAPFPNFQGEYRIVEVIGGVDGTTWTFNFYATADVDLQNPTIINSDAAAVAAFSVPLTSTGAVSYRMDARRLTGGVLTSLKLYIFVRRS